MKSRPTKKQMAKSFFNDERGAVAVEYIIIFTTMLLATIWVNKATDTLLFGTTPYDRVFSGLNAGREDIPDDVFDGETIEIIRHVGGDSPGSDPHPERSHLGQIYLHLSNP